jgi:NAD(P)-dependent dehydrogenase (short-subunit alcohol dehydrogenase family)
MSLSGKVAIVTGGGTGLGKAIALELAAAGADVVVAARRQEPLDQTASEIIAMGRKALAISTDIMDPDKVTAMVEQTTSTFGKVDILVNNSGVTAQDKFVDMPLKRWNLIFNVNVNGSAICTKAVLPQMMTHNSGIIINMSSILAVRVQYSVPYGASKAALERFTTGLARELRKTKISVCALRPYFVKTEVVTDFLDGKMDTSDWEEPEMWGKYCAMISTADPSATTGKIFDQALCKETFGAWK